MADSIGGNSVLSDSTGETPKVTPELAVENRTITSVRMAFDVCETLVSDTKEIIKKSARITAKLQGERPYDQRALKNLSKDHKTNVSTGFLATECGKLYPRFYMPIKTAKYLTAAQLPANWPNGSEKTAHFRQVITDTIRSWPKFNFYLRGKAREVVAYGYVFSFWPDNYEWRPTLLRMDRGFVPKGTEVMEDPQFFMAKIDYKPSELLNILKENVDAGRDEWIVDNVVRAINAAIPPPVDSTYPEARSYEELIRQSSWSYTYRKGAKMISTWHLFAKEASGSVSHYVLLADNGQSPSTQDSDGTLNGRLLYENLDQFTSMAEAVKTTVFEYGDGTIHGSWGAGQILYDLAVQVEKVRCDSIDNIRLTNKIKAHVPDAKNVNDVKLSIDDQMVIISGAQFAGNTAGLTADINGYEVLDQKLTQLAQQKIGAFVPPIPLQPSDIKAAQINAAMSKEKEVEEALLENWLIQWAEEVQQITKRLCNPDSNDPIAIDTRKRLMEKLTDEELDLLVNQFPVKSVMDFTEFKAQQRGMFAASVVNNPLFRQSQVARIMAEGAGDDAFVSSIVIPDGDQTDVMQAQRQQLLECSAMANGDAIPVIPNDNDWVHMQTLEPRLQQKLQSDQVDLNYAKLELQHYAAHWSQGVNKKTIPPDQINEKKAFIAAAEKNIAARLEQQQIQAQAQQAQIAAEQQAAELVATGQA